MTIEVGLLFGAIACVIGVAGFFGGRQSAAKNDGERWGKLEATLQYIKDDLASIKSSAEKNADGNKDSFRRVHERIDDHLRHEHGMTVPKRGDS